MAYCLLLISTTINYAQKVDFSGLANYLNSSKLDSAAILLGKMENVQKTVFDEAQFHYYSGISYKKKDLHHKGFEELILAKKQFKKLDSLSYVANTNYEIYDLLTHQQQLKIDKQPFLDEYIEYATKFRDPLFLARTYAAIATTHSNNDDFKNTNSFYRKSREQLQKINDTLRIAIIEMNIGVAYTTLTSKPDSALYYFRKTLPVFEKYGIEQFISANYNNQARAYEKKGDYEKAIELYNKTNNINLREYDVKTRAIYYKNQFEAYKKINDFKNASLYADKLLAIKDSIDNQSQNNAIVDAENKYRASEKEKLLLIEEQKKLRNRNIAFSLVGILILVGVIAYLINKNTKRKQLIAEQEREIEIRKTEKILKDQELTIIDAMISGQEKEREQLAGDLHDSVGATLAAAKLQFNHIKDNRGKIINEEELFKKTGELLEDAYVEIRTMAHLKNSGVLAKNSLLPAVEKLAKNASSTNNLTIEVQDFGLDERLENSLEIAIFRIIQELVTNIIKHSKASEASISITQHKDMLSIIVEDNGKGFDVKNAQFTEGLGLANIERRVEHMDGSIEVDSTPGKGTTVLIELPI